MMISANCKYGLQIKSLIGMIAEAYKPVKIVKQSKTNQHIIENITSSINDGLKELHAHGEKIDNIKKKSDQIEKKISYSDYILNKISA